MPPEAKKSGLKYGLDLDCFSFGHLALCLWNMTNESHIDESSITSEDLVNRQIQVGKRRSYFFLFSRKDDQLKQMLIKCLSDDRKMRPSSIELYSFLNNYVSKFKTVYEHLVHA